MGAKTTFGKSSYSIVPFYCALFQLLGLLCLSVPTPLSHHPSPPQHVHCSLFILLWATNSPRCHGVRQEGLRRVQQVAPSSAPTPSHICSCSFPSTFPYRSSTKILIKLKHEAVWDTRLCGKKILLLFYLPRLNRYQLSKRRGTRMQKKRTLRQEGRSSRWLFFLLIILLVSSNININQLVSNDKF